MTKLTQHWRKIAIVPAFAVGLAGCSSNMFGPNVPPDETRDNFLEAGEGQSRVLRGEQARQARNNELDWPVERETAVQIKGDGTYQGGLQGYIDYTRDFTNKNKHPYVQYPACQHFVNAVDQIDSKVSGAVAGGGVFAIVGSVIAGRGGAVAGGLLGAGAGALVNDMLNEDKLRRLNADCQSRLESNKILGGTVVPDHVRARVRGIYERVPQMQ